MPTNGDETLFQRYQREAEADERIARSLPWDWCRCHGKDCDRKAECLRHEQLSNMGPRTPIMERICAMGHEAESFVAIREEVK